MCVLGAKLKPAVFKMTCLCAAQFLIIPSIIPYRIGYWANSRSAIMSINTYRRAQSLGFGVYRQALQDNKVRAVATIAYCATNMLANVVYR